MSLIELIDECQRSGVRITIEGDQIVLYGDHDAAHRLAPLLRPHKEALFRALSNIEERYEERAAIMEYEGGLPRQDAERLALLDVEDMTPDWARALLEQWRPEGLPS
jgi:hypothetical protein